MDKVDIAAVLALSSALCVAIGDVLQQRATHRGGALAAVLFAFVSGSLWGIFAWEQSAFRAGALTVAMPTLQVSQPVVAALLGVGETLNTGGGAEQPA
jgi:glucose uptake protein GlcU